MLNSYFKYEERRKLFNEDFHIAHAFRICIILGDKVFQLKISKTKKLSFCCLNEYSLIKNYRTQKFNLVRSSS